MKQLILVLAVALANCGDTAPADQARETASTRGAEASSAPSPTPASSAALAAGQWFAKTERGSAMAMFGAPYSEATFSVRCEGGTLVFMRDAQVPAGQTEMQVTADGITRKLAAQSQQEPMPQVTAMLPADDDLAGALARTTEPITITVGGSGEVFRVPSSPEFRGAVSSCIAAS